MDRQIKHYVEELVANTNSEQVEANKSRPNLHSVDTNIPFATFHELEAIAAEYNVDTNSLASDLLTLGIAEAVAAMPDKDVRHMHEMQVLADREAQNRENEILSFDAGGT